MKYNLMKKSISLVLMALILPCFAVIAQETDPITIKFKKSDLEGNEVLLSAVADEISYIKLETHPDALIGSASRYHVKQIPHGYMIWNARGSGNIMMFNSEGKFKALVGSEGKGPGEYYGVYKVLYDKYLDNILVLLSKKVLRYNMDGKFVSSVDIDTNDSRIEKICVKDDQTWLFTYKKPLRESLFEVGVLATNKKGQLIKKYDLTDEKSPGCYSFFTQMNYVYQRGNDTYFIPYDYYKTYRLNKDDQWVPYLRIDAPFKKTPINLFKGGDMMKVNEVQRENGLILSAFVYGDHMIIHGATPRVFDILVDLESDEKMHYSYDMDFKKFGLTNDLDGGMPFFLRGFDSEGISLEMIDAVKILDYSENGLLKPDGKNHGKYMNLAEVLESTKPEDNPILVVVHIIY